MRRVLSSLLLAASSRSWLAALAALMVGCGSCGDKTKGSGGRAAEEKVRPVYESTGPVAPLAAQLCQALYRLPEERRAACCASPEGIVLADTCTGVLSASLQSHALVLDSAKVDVCTQALARAYAGCEWVGPFGPPLPPECQGLFSGRRSRGEVCRSSLECQGQLVCGGAGPTDSGRCMAPGERGASCSAAADPLATYTRQELETLHPACRGQCRLRRCEDAVAAGTGCDTTQRCGPGRHCEGGRCAEGLAKEGQPCFSGECAAGLRCLSGRCFAPLGAGAECNSDFECRGGCVAAATGRRCGMRCDLR